MVTKSGMARLETLLARWLLSGGTLEQSQGPQVRSHRTEPWAARLKGACQCCPGDGRTSCTWGGWRKHLAQVPPTESQCADALKGWDATRGAQELLTRAIYAAWTRDRPESLSMKKITVLSYLTKGLASNLKSTPKILSDTSNCEVWFLLTSLGTMISCLSVSFHQTNTPHLYPENRGATVGLLPQVPHMWWAITTNSSDWGEGKAKRITTRNVKEQQISPEKPIYHVFQATSRARLPLLVTGKASSLAAGAISGTQMWFCVL